MLTGKDIIVYILENDLVNTEFVADKIFDDLFIGASEVAEYFGVGVATIEAMYKLKRIRGIKINGELYFPRVLVRAKGDAEVDEK